MNEVGEGKYKNLKNTTMNKSKNFTVIEKLGTDNINDISTFFHKIRQYIFSYHQKKKNLEQRNKNGTLL